MQRFWSWLAVELGKRAGLVAVIGLLITLIAGYGTTKLKFATGQDSYLNSERPGRQGQRRLPGPLRRRGHARAAHRRTTGKNVVDLRTRTTWPRWTGSSPSCGRTPTSSRPWSRPGTALEWSDNLIQKDADGQVAADPTGSVAGKALLTALNATSPTASRRARRARPPAWPTRPRRSTRLGAIPAAERTLDNRGLGRFLIYDNQDEIRKPLERGLHRQDPRPDRRAAVGNASIETEGAGAVLVQDTIEDADFENGTVTVTGARVLLKQINDYLKGGMLTLGAIAVVVMTIILLLLFNVRWRLLPLVVILVGVIWAFGLAGYLGIPLSLVTIAGLPVMLGIGIDYAIQMHARVEEEVIIDHAEHPIQETARNLCPALLVVTFDAVFAFLALRFAKVPMIRQFGLLLAVGIAVICFASIIVPLATLGIREFKSPTKAKDFREGFLGRLTVKLGSLPAVGRPGAGRRQLRRLLRRPRGRGQDHAPERPGAVGQPALAGHQGLPHRRGPDRVELRARHLRAEPTTCSRSRHRRLRRASIDRSATSTRHQEQLLGASSLVATMDYLIEVPGADIVYVTPDGRPRRLRRGARGHPPVDRRARERRRHAAGAAGPQPGALNIIFRYGPGSLEERKVVVNEIRDTTQPRPRASAPRRRASPSSASACSRTSPATGRCSPTCPSPSSASSSPSGCGASCARCCRWCRCSSPSARPTSWPGASTSSSARSPPSAVRSWSRPAPSSPR